VVGLRQLAWFTVAGLAAAGLTTRYLLPRLLPLPAREAAQGALLDRIHALFERAPHSRWLALVWLVLAGVAIAAARHPFWENDLSKLTPVPAELLQQDQALRANLGTPDVRYLLALEAQDAQAALQRLEALTPSLDRAVASGAISGFDHAARYTPSAQTQLARQQALPTPQALRAALQQALQDSPFERDAFEPFVEDVERARTLPPLTPGMLASTPFGSSVEMLLAARPTGTRALVTFSGVADPQALAALARSAGPDVRLLDLKDASESLVAKQRRHILWSLAAAAVLLIAAVLVSLRSARRVLRVVAPMGLTTIVIIAVLQLAGVSLNLFHLIALILAAGLGLDYALFFEAAAHDVAEQRRTLHAILVCSCSTLLVFALLATSSLPVLRAIGVTVSIGVVSNFLLAMLMTRRAGAAAH
jgi:predicted exporter